MQRRVIAIVAAALLLALGMASLGLVSARALRERDRAVRDGVLLRLAQELETELRHSGPPGDRVLSAFEERHRGVVSGVELATDAGVLARAGTASDDPTESVAALGPAWRGLAAHSGYRPGSPPFVLRLFPGGSLGRHGRIASAVVAGSAAASAALFGFALLAARGLVERERRLESENEQKRLRLAAVAGAGLAHRIRTPLATIRGTAQLIESAGTATPERARRIVDETARIDGMIRRLLDFARPADPQPERFDVTAVVRTVAARFPGVVVPDAPISFAFGDPSHFDTALEELLANARAFDSATIEVTICRDGRSIAVDVRDHGPGLAITSEEAVEPYVTTRADGAGLGLAIAQALIRANRGDLRIRSADDGGCIASIRLPEAQ